MMRRGRGRPPKNPNFIGEGSMTKSDPYDTMPDGSQMRTMGGQGGDMMMGQRDCSGRDRDFQCNKCDKTYLSYPALYLHQKIKHMQGEGIPMESLKRGRGRPKKDGYYASGPGAGGRLDPTNDLFLRTEEREGGPVDPLACFEDTVNMLFQ